MVRAIAIVALSNFAASKVLNLATNQAGPLSVVSCQGYPSSDKTNILRTKDFKKQAEEETASAEWSSKKERLLKRAEKRDKSERT